MRNLNPPKQRSKSVDLETDDNNKPQFNSLEHIDEESNLRSTLKKGESSDLGEFDHRIGQNLTVKFPSTGQTVSKPKFVIHNNTKLAGYNPNAVTQPITENKPSNKNLKQQAISTNNNITQKLPQMTNSIVKKTKQQIDLKKTVPFTDLTNPLQNTQMKKLQQVKKAIEEKKALINQFESVNRYFK